LGKNLIEGKKEKVGNIAKIILESFKQLKVNLEITDLQHSKVSTRQQKVRKVVENEFNVLDSFLTGSYSRHTMIAPLSEADIDIFIILHSSYYKEDGQADLLDKVRRALLKTYTNIPKISRNGQAVTITFTDFIVDVVPAFNRRNGGYLIPNSITKNWLSTDPKKHVEIMSIQNKKHDDDLVPLIKMIKGWNKVINDNFRSFHLEVMALQILNGVKISDYPSGIRYFFDKGRSYVKEKNPDPAGYEGDVGNYLNTQEKSDVTNKFETAYNRAKKAEDYEKNDDTESAVGEWKKIFGNYFPSYR